MEIKGKTFLVTGGAGLMGSHIAERLVSADAERVILLDNMVRGSMGNILHLLSDPKVILIKGDIRDLNLMRTVSTGVDGIFHMAALRITACAADPREAMEVMLMGLQNVLQVMVEKQVRRLLYASSASIYGLADSFPTSESHPPYNNRTYYGAAKIAGEGMARSFAEMYGMEYVALRYFNVYGPRMDMHGKYTEVLVRWLDRIEQGEAPLIFGNGTQTMDLVNIEDVTDANILAMQSDVTDEVFNVGSGSETSLLELLNTLLRVTGSSLAPEFMPERTVNPVPRRLADTQKAETLLGFKARVGLEEGLRRLVAWRQSLAQAASEGETPIQSESGMRA